MKTLNKLYIGGKWTKTQGRKSEILINPATEKPFALVTRANQVDVESAICAAKNSLPIWSRTSSNTRRKLMLATADEMKNRYEDLVEAHTISMGCPKHIAGEAHVDGAIAGLKYYADLAHRVDDAEISGNVSVIKEPIGVCALINPWNYPLHQLIGKVAPALAVGCTIIAKPAEQTPLQDLIMAEIFDKIGLPDGVFNLVLGSGSQIGPILSSHPDISMVSFTGSTSAGIHVASSAAPSVKRVCQELGGKSALIITDDADLETAVRYGVEDVVYNTGQTCNGLTRMLVPENVYDRAVTIAATVANEQIVGDPLDDTVTMGPMVSQHQRKTVLEYIKLGIKEGARLVAGGIEMPEGIHSGFYIKPTVFADVRNDMRIAREEIFGPVLCMIPYQNIEEAISIANDSEYGLSSGVYAKDRTAAIEIARKIQAGQCYIQGSFFTVNAPFGGYKKSGNGREWGFQGMHEYIETKAIIG